MIIIGHRGAAGEALENTESSLRAGLKSRANVIEIDVRSTKDNHLVLCHDHDLVRIASNPIVVAEELLKTLKTTKLNKNELLLDLRAALKIVGKHPLIIELKDEFSGELLLKALTEFPDVSASVASFDFDELLKLQKLTPSLRLYALEQTKPTETLKRAKDSGFYGVGLNFWLINPYTYFLAKRYRLDLYVYTVNNRFLVKFLSLLYPGIAICTDFPGRFSRRRSLRKR